MACFGKVEEKDLFLLNFDRKDPERSQELFEGKK